ncbi:unnamed protein product, partial [Mesorhabditis spiculigera]
MATLIIEKKDLNMEQLSTCYVCQKCKNHGLLKWKKDHKKQCAYLKCGCAQCQLIETRRALDRTIKEERCRAGPSHENQTPKSAESQEIAFKPEAAEDERAQPLKEYWDPIHITPQPSTLNYGWLMYMQTQSPSYPTCYHPDNDDLKPPNQNSHHQKRPFTIESILCLQSEI